MLKFKMVVIIIAVITMGGAVYLINDSNMENLRNQPEIFVAQFGVDRHGLFMYSSDLKEEKVLLDFPITPFAGVAKNTEGNKLLIREATIPQVLKNNTLEYDIVKKDYISLEDAMILQSNLQSVTGKNLEILNLGYIQNSEDYSFVYGTHGDIEGNGTFYILHRGTGNLDAISQVDGNSRYQWTKDGLGVYFARGGILYFRNMVSGEEKAVLEGVENFSVSSDETLIALWRKQKEGNTYVLYLYDMIEKTEKKIKQSDTQYGHVVCFSPDGTFLLFITKDPGFLGSLVNRRKPTMRIYDIRKDKIVKIRNGDYNDTWYSATW